MLGSITVSSAIVLASCGGDSPWTKVLPGGDSICGDGSDYVFWELEGAPDNNNLLVLIEGGGACWDEFTCSLGTGSTSIAGNRDPGINPKGVLNIENELNPFKDWNMVFVPFCTADIHWGNKTVSYNDKLTVHHNGYNNLMSVLDWITESYGLIDTMFVTGESAGSYGSRLFAINAMEEYADSDTRFIHLSDSANGVIAKRWLLSSFNNWGAYEIRPDWIPEIYNEPLENLDMQVVDAAVANFYPQHTFAEFNSYGDVVQKMFYTIMGGLPWTWTDQMWNNVSDLQVMAENYRSYTLRGDSHTIMKNSNFYVANESGTPFIDWIKDLVDGVDAPNVSCPDAETCNQRNTAKVLSEK